MLLRGLGLVDSRPSSAWPTHFSLLWRCQSALVARCPDESWTKISSGQDPARTFGLWGAFRRGRFPPRLRLPASLGAHLAALKSPFGEHFVCASRSLPDEAWTIRLRSGSRSNFELDRGFNNGRSDFQWDPDPTSSWIAVSAPGDPVSTGIPIQLRVGSRFQHRVIRLSVGSRSNFELDRGFSSG